MKAKTIVIVDDDETLRKTFSLLLKGKYRVLVAGDPEEALARLRRSKADLLIADYRLPTLNGLELIRRLRAAGFDGEAMLISAHPDEVRVEEMSRLAISHFFVKPLDLDLLNASIDRVLQPKKLEGASA
ncbi:MAG TPA: response regulator [Burkholderiales bacterium]|nr:response regulator [Burkholderiales bacterium]